MSKYRFSVAMRSMCIWFIPQDQLNVFRTFNSSLDEQRLQTKKNERKKNHWNLKQWQMIAIEVWLCFSHLNYYYYIVFRSLHLCGIWLRRISSYCTLVQSVGKIIMPFAVSISYSAHMNCTWINALKMLLKQLMLWWSYEIHICSLYFRSHIRLYRFAAAAWHCIENTSLFWMLKHLICTEAEQ